MVNPNRWSWSGGPRKAQAREDAVVNRQSLSRSCDKPELREVDVPENQNLDPAATSVSSRRLSKNRWSWRPDAAISVTLEDQQEAEQDENRGQADKPTNNSRRLSKDMKKTGAPLPRPRPSSMIAPASSAFGASSSYSSYKSASHQQPQQRQDEDQPSAGVKNAFNHFLNRRISIYQINKKGAQVQHQNQQAQAEPTPPPSRGQQQQTPGPMQMQSSMRHRPHLHDPQNTLRASPAPVPHVQTQGHIDNGRVVAPLPGLDENSQLQLPSVTNRPATATGATSADSGTTSPSAAAPSAEETGLLGRLVRRRLVPKEKDGENHKKRWTSTGAGDDANLPSGAGNRIRGSPHPSPTSETTQQRELNAQPLLLNPSLHTRQSKSNSIPKRETASDVQSPLKSSGPRFSQATKPQKSSATMTQTVGAAIPHKSKSLSQLQPMPPSTSTSAAQPKMRPKLSFGKRFWSRGAANDFDHVTKTETPAQAPAPRTVYVPKHAAADFSRTTYTPHHARHDFVHSDGRDNGLRPLATITANAREDGSESCQRQPVPFAEKVEKRKSRDVSSSKFEAPSPLELHRRLEIVKSSEIEVVTTREPAATDPWQLQYNLSLNDSNTSSNGKAPAPRTQSRPRSSKRHSFNLVSDPYARELTPPKSASPVEMEAPFDPPSQTAQQQAPNAAPQRPMSSHARPQSRQDTRTKEATTKEMTDFERFLADAEATDREYNAQMWRNLARRSGHYGYSDNPWSAIRPTDPCLTGVGAANATAHRSNKRDSAYYSVGKRASMMSFAAADDERKLVLSSFYGPPTGAHSSSVGADGKRGLRRQGSVSKRISDYIKPPKPSHEPTYEDWPTGRANRRSFIA